jgi:uncharacterized glyoxalase superfamily protein PhnB
MACVFRPSVIYEDPRAAIRWLEEAFGFELAMMVEGPDGELGHCQMRYGEALIAIGRRWIEDAVSPRMLGGRFTQMVSLILDDDIDAHFARARDAGAEILAEPEDKFYGDRSYACRDLEGHMWSFSQPVREVTIAEMEAASGFTIHTTPGR